MKQDAVWPYARYFLHPYRALALGTLLMMVLAAGLEALTIGLLLPLFAMLTGKDFVSSDGMMTQILKGLIAAFPVEDEIIRTLFCVTVVGISAEAARFATTVLTAQLSTTARRDVSVQVFSHLLNADVRRIGRSPQGEWLHRVIMAPFQMTTFFTLTPQLGAQLLRVIAIVLLLAAISWPLMVAGIAVGWSFYAVTRYVGKTHLLTLGERQVKSTEAQASTVTQGLGGVREIKVYDVVFRWLNQFRQATDAYTAQATKQTLVQLLPVNALPLVFLLIVVGGVWVSQHWAGEAYGSWVPTLAVFVAGLGRLSSELSAHGKCQMQIVGMLPFATTVHGELNTPPLRRTQPESGAIAPPRIIRFENVSYAHEGRTKTLDGVSFDIKRGEITALVGPSGCGKSTLVDLLLGLYPPDAGRLLIDGRDLQDIPADQWHGHVGYVGQELFLFHGTIRENITMGREASHDEVRGAAELARAGAFIANRPGGVESVVGDRGAQVSGGERQRLTIARALLRRPGLVLLDEATSSLDVQQEQRLMAEIKEVSKDCIVLVVSHRLASLALAEQIVVMDEGRVVEIGTHRSLVKEGTVYRRLWEAQAVA